MGRIRRLSQEVIGKIAAGEVVERPQAVVKELVENSLDAGATGITVEIVRGGLDKIKVLDNGLGIAEEDLALAFEKNATSKLFNSEELFRVETLGFRGEALHSIAAVSRVTLLTRQKGRDSGIRLKNSGGTIEDIQPAACAEGTSITVSDLFFNAPVRRDFLKKPSQEAGLVSDLMRLLILSHPEVSFRFKSDSNTIYFSAGDGKLDSAFLSVYGLQTLKNMKKVEHNENGIIVKGLVGVGAASRGNRSHQNFFINGRAFKSSLVSNALETAVRQRVMIGRFPMAVLYIAMPYNKVDVNVHPNKWEVRFSDEKKLHDAVLHAVEEALNEGIASSEPEAFFKEEGQLKNKANIVEKTPESKYAGGELPNKADKEKSKASPYLFVKDPAWKQSAVLEPDSLKQGPENLSAFEKASESSDENSAGSSSLSFSKESNFEFEKPLEESHIEQTAFSVPKKQLKFIGSLFNTYILFQSDDVFYLCDQHAAHERILFEKMQRAHDEGAISQMLLMPQLIKLSLKSLGVFLENQALLASAGYDAEDFGEQTVKLHSVPLVLGMPEAKSSFLEALDTLESTGSLPNDRKFDRLLYAACRHAIKGGDMLSKEDMVALLEEMLSRDVIPTCPHGRPIVLSIGKKEIEKRFGRIQS